MFAARKTGGPLKTKQLCLGCTRNRSFANEERILTIPYVPRAVKDHYRHLEGLKQKTEMEITSRNRSLKLHKETQMQHLLNIQRVWRGYKARKNVDTFLKERRLWFDRRRADTHRRTRFKYQIACFLGRGPLLESDTDQETVMKKVPYWARKTAIDVIKGRPATVWNPRSQGGQQVIVIGGLNLRTMSKNKIHS